MHKYFTNYTVFLVKLAFFKISVNAIFKYSYQNQNIYIFSRIFALELNPFRMLIKTGKHQQCWYFPVLPNTSYSMFLDFSSTFTHTA